MHLNEAIENCSYQTTKNSNYSFFFSPKPQRLSNAYDSLAKAYKKVVEVMKSGRRLLGKYFRVAFFGQVNGAIFNLFK